MQESIFQSRSIEQVYLAIQEVYLSDSRPWIVAYSGGKDSTATLQMVWKAVQRLPETDRKKPVFVVNSDTWVENPLVAAKMQQALDRIDASAKQAGLPISCVRVEPALADSFWVSLIGHGYAAPSIRFRWCTDRLKIKPTTRFILQCVSRFGEVVIVLGVRKAESESRARAMTAHSTEASGISRHSTLPSAYVFSPLEDFTVQDVWSYLLQVDSPWGDDNQELLDLYRSAQAGDCPLVVDYTTSPCGGSRFGCWTCTVVDKDHSMEQLVASGEDWLSSLLDLRDFLRETQDPERKREFRDFRRKDGRVWLKADGTPVPGPYTLDTCKHILGLVLKAQREADTFHPGADLKVVRESELHEIRRIWRFQRNDWEDSVPGVYRSVFGADLDWLPDDASHRGAVDRETIERVCAQHGLPGELLARLLDLESDYQGMARRSSVFKAIDALFSREWRPLEQVLASARQEGVASDPE